MRERPSMELIGDEPASSADGGQDSWMISYLDVLTLIIAFFVLMLALSEPKSEETAMSAVTQTDIEPGGEQDQQAPHASEADALQPADDGSGADEAPERRSGADTGALADAGGQAEDLLQALATLQVQGVEVIPDDEGITLRIVDDMLFDSGQAELTIDGLLLMESLQDFLTLFDGAVSVEGHTDSVPINNTRFPSNWELSSARAIAVVRYFEEGERLRSRFQAVGHADRQPLQSNATAQGRAANRRVELVLRER